jgi:hypothetical protein
MWVKISGGQRQYKIDCIIFINFGYVIIINHPFFWGYPILTHTTQIPSSHLLEKPLHVQVRRSRYALVAAVARGLNFWGPRGVKDVKVGKTGGIR